MSQSVILTIPYVSSHSQSGLNWLISRMTCLVLLIFASTYYLWFAHDHILLWHHSKFNDLRLGHGKVSKGKRVLRGMCHHPTVSPDQNLKIRLPTVLSEEQRLFKCFHINDQHELFLHGVYRSTCRSTWSFLRVLPLSSFGPFLHL